MAEAHHSTEEPLSQGPASILLEAIESQQFRWCRLEIRKFVLRGYSDSEGPYDPEALTDQGLDFLRRHLRKLAKAEVIVVNLRGLIYIAGRSACRAALKKEKRRRKSHFEFVPLKLELVETRLDPYQSTLRLERQEQLQKAIDKLSTREATVFVLRRTYGYSEEETSAILRVPVGTVKSRLYDADTKLRELLSDLYEDMTGREVRK